MSLHFEHVFLLHVILGQITCHFRIDYTCHSLFTCYFKIDYTCHFTCHPRIYHMSFSHVILGYIIHVIHPHAILRQACFFFIGCKCTFSPYILVFFHFSPYILILPLLVPKSTNAFFFGPFLLAHYRKLLRWQMKLLK